MADDGHKVAFAPRLHLEDGEAVVLIVEGHTLDGPDECLSWRGSAIIMGFQFSNTVAEDVARLT